MTIQYIYLAKPKKGAKRSKKSCKVCDSVELCVRHFIVDMPMTFSLNELYIIFGH